GLRPSSVDQKVAEVAELLGGAGARGGLAEAIERWRAGAAALRFHLRREKPEPVIVAVLGGTGTGKSTIVNRLVGADVSGASFRRTFTAGAIAVTSDRAGVPKDYLGLPLREAD